MPHTVLVTGASGFVATDVVQTFLDAGYNVRGTVRSQKTADGVKSIFKSDAISFAIVPDISQPGAFDEAVKGVDGVVHVASPFVLQVNDNKKDMLDPAINGTLEILRSVKKNAPKVKRVVITSSAVANLDLSKGNNPGYNYTENDWNPATYEEAVASSNGVFVYCASKALAEKAALEFAKDANFTLSTLTPPMVYGPAKQHIDSLEKLNTSTGDIYRFMNGSTEKVELNGFWAFVDVRDLAAAHLKAYEAEEHGRFVINGGYYNYQQVVDILRKVPGVDQSKVSKDADIEWPKVYKIDNSKSVNKLGMKYRTLEESVTDAAKQLVEIENRLKQSA